MARVFRFVCAGIVTFGTLAWGQLADHIVISECAPGGGSGLTEALYQRDWVELYNPTNAPVNLNGWTLQYKSSTGTGNYGIDYTFGNVTMAPHSYYLIVGGTAGTGGAVLTPSPDGDAGSGLAMGASAGRLALCNSTAAIISGAEASATNIVDFIGWGTSAVYSEGGSDAPAASNTLTLERKARCASNAAALAAGGSDAANGNGWDSDNNGFDFVKQSVPTPQNSASYVIEVPSSSETRSIGAATGSNYFIVGDGTNSYEANIDVTAAGTAGTTTVAVMTGAAATNGGILAAKKIIGTYYVISSSAVGVMYTLSLDYLHSQYASIVSPILTESALFLSRRTGMNTYQNFVRGAGSMLSSSIANGRVQACGVTAFGDWFIAADNTAPLPVELAEFTASRKDASVILVWKTAMEVNNHGFEIERRRETSSAWMTVGFVEGSGTCSSPNQYRFTDHGAPQDPLIYRLTQIDADGASLYSEERRVDPGAAPAALALLNNYPNPFNPSTEIIFTVPSEGWTRLEVFDALGERVAVLFDGVAQPGRYLKATFNAARFSSGVYYACLRCEGRRLVRNMIVSK
ncbi:MAG: lamin tail domain-containing protein [Acidobacteriota bacterium]